MDNAKEQCDCITSSLFPHRRFKCFMRSKTSPSYDVIPIPSSKGPKGSKGSKGFTLRPMSRVSIPPPSSYRDDSKKVKKRTKKNIPASLKATVWNTYIGKEYGCYTCLCCKTAEITQLNFHCGHVISEYSGGELKLYNLRPICSKCNQSMNKKNMEQFMVENGFI